MVIGRRAGECGLDRDCPCCSPGAEHDECLARGVDDRTQRRQEALAVGVLPDESVAVADDAVDRADDRCGFTEPVEVLDHGHLVGDRAVEADPAHRPRATDRVAEGGGGDVAVDVARGESVLLVGRLDHRHGRVPGGRRGK